MTNRANLPVRRSQAEYLAERVTVLSRDEFGRVRRALVPSWSTPNRTYTVELFRNEAAGAIFVDCPCQGNGSGTVCKHGMAVLIYAAREAEGQVKFTHSPQAAEKLAQLGGRAWMLAPSTGTGKMGIVTLAARQGKPERELPGDRALPATTRANGSKMFK